MKSRKNIIIISIAAIIVAIAASYSFSGKTTNEETVADTSHTSDSAVSQDTQKTEDSPKEEEKGLFASIFSSSDSAKPAGSPQEQEKKNEEVEKFLEKSRIAEDFSAIEGMVDQQVDFIKDMMKLSPEGAGELGDVLGEYLNSEKMTKRYTDLLKERLSAAELEELNTLQQDPMVQFRAEKERYFRTKEGNEEMYEHMMATNKKEEPIPKNKEDIISKMSEKSANQTVETFSQLSNMVETTFGAGQATPKDKSPQAKELEESSKAAMKEAFLNAEKLKNRKIHENTSPEDLKRLYEIEEKSVMKKENDIRNEVIKGTLLNPKMLKATSSVMEKETKRKDGEKNL